MFGENFLSTEPARLCNTNLLDVNKQIVGNTSIVNDFQVVRCAEFAAL